MIKTPLILSLLFLGTLAHAELLPELSGDQSLVHNDDDNYRKQKMEEADDELQEPIIYTLNKRPEMEVTVHPRIPAATSGEKKSLEQKPLPKEVPLVSPPLELED